jgi:lysophospholipase L1-like esterase
VQPRAVSMLIGTNDLDQGSEPETIAANVKAIIAALHKADPKLPVIINKVMPRGPRPNRPFSALIPKLNGLYEAAFKDDPLVTFCDTYSLFDDGQASVKKEEFPDLLHPNAAGYAEWTGALRPIFEKLKLEAR